MCPARRSSRNSSRGGRDSRRGSRRDDRSRSSARGRTDDRGGGRSSGRDERATGRYPPVKSGGNTPLIVGGVVGAVVLLGAAAIAFSGKKKPVVRRPKTVVVAPKRVPQTKDWYNIGRRRGFEWKRHATARAPMASAAGGGTNALEPKNVRNTADMMTSDYYNKGLRNNPEGQKRFIQGFCDAVSGN